jgi:hypothetical protein
MTLVPTDPIPLLDGMTALAGGIELGGDFTIVVEPISSTELTVDSGGNFVVLVVHDGVRLLLSLTNVKSCFRDLEQSKGSDRSS